MTDFQEDGVESLESLEDLADAGLREDETSDPELAAEEGLAYVPPTDPPVIPADNKEGIEIAAGFGATSLDEPYDEDHPSELLTPEDEMTARVREALRADAETSRYADDVGIESDGGLVLLRGMVDDLEDSDALVAVASEVNGVVEVRDELEVPGL